MSSLLTPELLKSIGEVLISWGGPGIFIIFLLEERRRLMNKVETLQNKLDASYQANLTTHKETSELMRDTEVTMTRLENAIGGVLSYKPKR